MAFQRTSGDPYDNLADINVTPLVDVMLVLLIIFMVTARLIMNRAIPGVESVSDGVYRRAVRIKDASGWITVSPGRRAFTRSRKREVTVWPWTSTMAFSESITGVVHLAATGASSPPTKKTTLRSCKEQKNSRKRISRRSAAAAAEIGLLDTHRSSRFVLL